MPRGRAGKKAEAVVVQSAELIGWAVGGIEREIQQTRQRLAALMAQAEHLRRRAASGRARGPRPLQPSTLLPWCHAGVGAECRLKHESVFPSA